MNQIWIVQGRCGEYSDAQEWPVAWCETEAEANQLRDKCQAENDSLTEDEQHAYTSDEQHRRKAKLLSDPGWHTDYTGTRYSVYSLDRWTESK